MSLLPTVTPNDFSEKLIGNLTFRIVMKISGTCYSPRLTLLLDNSIKINLICFSIYFFTMFQKYIRKFYKALCPLHANNLLFFNQKENCSDYSITMFSLGIFIYLHLEETGDIHYWYLLICHPQICFME